MQEHAVTILITAIVALTLVFIIVASANMPQRSGPVSFWLRVLSGPSWPDPEESTAQQHTAVPEAVAPVAPQPRREIQAQLRSDSRVVLSLGEDKSYHVQCSINGVSFDAVVDTGANVCTLPEDLARRIGINPKSLPYEGKIVSASGHSAETRAGLMTWLVGGKLQATDATTHVKLGYKLKTERNPSGINALLGMTALDQFDVRTGGGGMIIGPLGRN